MQFVDGMKWKFVDGHEVEVWLLDGEVVFSIDGTDPL
jgi:hypothetical protein